MPDPPPEHPVIDPGSSIWSHRTRFTGAGERSFPGSTERGSARPVPHPARATPSRTGRDPRHGRIRIRTPRAGFARRRVGSRHCGQAAPWTGRSALAGARWHRSPRNSFGRRSSPGIALVARRSFDRGPRSAAARPTTWTSMLPRTRPASESPPPRPRARRWFATIREDRNLDMGRLHAGPTRRRKVAGCR